MTNILNLVMNKNNLIIDDILNSNRNYLIHGPGGTGKSFLIKQLSDEFESRFKIIYKNKSRLIRTATTGIAAVNINGTTFHRFAGIGMGQKSKEELLLDVLKNRKACERWKKTVLLIIDEISMFGAQLYDKIDYIAKQIRQSDEPLGGLRVIMSGDFLQLPPVNDTWIFKSNEFKKLNLKPIIMKEYKRFDDTSFIQMLERMRTADINENDIEKLFECCLKYNNYRNITHEIEPTILFSKKINVAEINENRLNEIMSQEYTYVAEDSLYNKKSQSIDFINDANYRQFFNETIDSVIKLKIGAQVMLKSNLDINKGLVNGSRGVVIDLNENWVRVKFINNIETIYRHKWDSEDDHYIISRTQIPLILAWSLTVHKTQGCTLDNVICDLGDSIFEAGQAYVALSRVRNYKSLYIKNILVESIFADKEAIDYVKKLEK